MAPSLLEMAPSLLEMAPSLLEMNAPLLDAAGSFRDAIRPLLEMTLPLLEMIHSFRTATRPFLEMNCSLIHATGSFRHAHIQNQNPVAQPDAEFQEKSALGPPATIIGDAPIRQTCRMHSTRLSKPNQSHRHAPPAAISTLQPVIRRWARPISSEIATQPSATNS
jgi:hypothetical protein